MIEVSTKGGIPVSMALEGMLELGGNDPISVLSKNPLGQNGYREYRRKVALQLQKRSKNTGLRGWLFLTVRIIPFL